MNNKAQDAYRYEGEERRNMEEYPTPWHVSKEVSVGHIISTVALLLAAITSWMTMDTRITVLETKYNGHVYSQQIQEEKQDAANHQILNAVKEVDGKLTDLSIKVGSKR